MAEEAERIEVLITDGCNADFLLLAGLLDCDLNARYGELQKQYDKHNKTDGIGNAIVVYKAGNPAACGAFKEHSRESVEIKRVFVRPSFRRQGLARVVMRELESSARSLGYRHAVLETGIKQTEAISLYQSLGYDIIDNYGPYEGCANSVCMKKDFITV